MAAPRVADAEDLGCAGRHAGWLLVVAQGVFILELMGFFCVLVCVSK